MTELGTHFMPDEEKNRDNCSNGLQSDHRYCKIAEFKSVALITTVHRHYEYNHRNIFVNNQRTKRFSKPIKVFMFLFYQN